MSKRVAVLMLTLLEIKKVLYKNFIIPNLTISFTGTEFYIVKFTVGGFSNVSQISNNFK